MLWRVCKYFVTVVDVTPTGFSDGGLTAFYREVPPTGLKRSALKIGFTPTGLKRSALKIGRIPLSYKDIGCLGILNAKNFTHPYLAYVPTHGVCLLPYASIRG